MTREEAKTVFLNRGYVEVEGGTIYDPDKWREACAVISKWVEQEPRYCDRNICLKNECNGIGCDECEVTKSQEPSGDLIQRQAALDIVDSYSESQSNVEDVTQDIISDIVVLPSVKPQEKTGHWIEGKCDQCGGHAPFWSMATTYYKSKYCPNCGARMVEPQESEEQTDVT